MRLKHLTRLAAGALAALTLALPAAADDDRRSKRDHHGERVWSKHDDLHGGRHHKDRDHRSRHRGGEAIILYSGSRFSGESIEVTGPIRYLRRTGLNDRVSSLRVLSGTWQVCTHPDFRGRCEIFTGRAPRLSRLDLNDTISSIRPVRGRHARHDRDWRHDRDDRYDRDYRHDRRDGVTGIRRADIVLFAHPNGRGGSLGVDGAIRDLRRFRMNDTISSVDVRRGAWLVCSDPNFRGRCRVVDRSIGNMRRIGMDDNITSIRRYDRRRDRDYANRHDRYGDRDWR